MPDKILTCKDCNSKFTFTEGEQAFYQVKGFMNDPQRCGDCRKAKKQQKTNNNFGGFNRSFGREYGSSRW